MDIRQKKILLMVKVLMVSSLVSAQPWVYHYLSKLKSTEERNLTIEEQKSAFENYWRGKEVERGKGFNPYKRWEYFITPRIASSTVLDNSALWEAIKMSNLDPEDTLSWHFVGPGTTPYKIQTTNLSGSGRLNCIAFHPVDSNIIFVGAPSGGVWMTRDGGEHWETSTDYLSAIGISDIVISHEDTSVIYLATGDAGDFDTYAIGIVKSSDGGKTWATTALDMNVEQQNYFSRIIMHPDNADIMLATSSKGIYKTTNGWLTFTLVQSGNFRDIEFKPGNPEYIYATSYSNIGNAKIYRSTNTGSSFQEVSGGLLINGKVERIELAVTENDPNIVYAVAVDVVNAGLYGVFRSTNSGSTWQIIYYDYPYNLLGLSSDGSSVGGQGFFDLAMAVDPNNKSNVIVGGINNWKSQDGGFNWEISSIQHHTVQNKYVHADQHMLAYSPHGNRTLYTVNDGGVYKSYNNGDNWIDITNNMQILQVYRLSSSFLTENKLLCGNQDNGTFLHSKGNWYEILGGDGMECYIDPLNDSILYFSLYYGKLFKSTDEGITREDIMPDVTLKGAWLTPFVLHPHNSSWLYAGYNDVYKSENGGEEWKKLSEGLSSTNLISLVIAPSNDQYIYASSYENIFKTENGGDEWSLISIPLPTIPFSSVTVSPNDPNKIWVTLSGFEANKKVYYSFDGGTNWGNFSDGLPNVPVNDLVVRYNSNQELYAATDIGVYYRNADMENWINLSENLPNVIVSELEISEQFQKLRAATYGRGIWELDLPPAIPSKADFKADVTIGCTNAPVKLSYSGKSEFDSLVWIHNAQTVVSSSPNNDTIIVQYTTEGQHTVGLRHFRGDTITSEVKYQYLNISSSIDFPISPDQYYSCDTTNITIYLPEGYEYNWNPEIPLDSVNKHIINLKPELNTTYQLSVLHGDCEVTKDFILFMPDEICKAIYLPEGDTGRFSNACATVTSLEPTPGIGTGHDNGCVSQDGWCSDQNVIDNSVWFKLVVPESGKLRVRVSGFDAQIALYKAESCNDIFEGGNYELIAANDDMSSSNSNSEIALLENLNPGDTLYLQVDGSYGGVTGEFNIKITDKPTPTHFPQNNLKSKIYPNPANDELRIKLDFDGISNIRIELLSETGSIVRQKLLSGIRGQVYEKFNTSDLTGFYLVRVILDDYQYYYKVIIK
jgi:photosystem II stability/assembly factor-like uncharacterized protein